MPTAAMTLYPPETENLDRIRRELLDGMNRIDRMKKRIGKVGRILKLLHFFHRSSCLLHLFSHLHPFKLHSNHGGHALFCMLISACLVGTSTGQDGPGLDDYMPGTPFVYLFDTNHNSTGLLSISLLNRKNGWTMVPEDDTEHAFKGDAVLANDKLTVVLRRKGPGAEVYSQTSTGLRFRAVVMAADKTALRVDGISSIQIHENNLGAVELTANCETYGHVAGCSVSFRLTTGEAMLEMNGGQAADRFFVWCRSRYVVVPNFFGQGMAFDIRDSQLPRFGLPSENMLLNLIGDGDAVCTCVWRSNQRQAHAIPPRQETNGGLAGCEIEGGNGQELWVAFLEAPAVWRQSVFSTDDEWQADSMSWEPPFDGEWQNDQVWLEGEPQADRGVIYPRDRTPQTPLPVVCPTDVLRNALGVGPCKYILDSEGLASDENPTPDNLMDWVEQQFEKNRQEQAVDEIEKRLGLMVEHVRSVQARVERYGGFARRIRAVCQTTSNGEQLPSGAINRIVDRIWSTVTNCRWSVMSDSAETELAPRYAERMMRLAEQDGTLSDCRQLGGDLRRIGARQQNALAVCRMQVRWLREQARVMVGNNDQDAKLANQVWIETERFLKKQQAPSK